MQNSTVGTQASSLCIQKVNVEITILLDTDIGVYLHTLQNFAYSNLIYWQ